MPKGRILAVDDQRYFRELIEGLLTEEGFEARTAASGEEALRMLEKSRFDVVVTDLVMPGMDGSELVHRVKERDPDQEIVVVTGVVDVKTAVDAMKLGATDYLLKPFDRKTLAVSLDTILERRRLRFEHGRLLAENIEYLGERSLFERAIKLFACLSVEPLAHRIVEDLCLETHAQGGVIWADVTGGSDRLDLVAAGGLVRLDEEPRELAREALPPEIDNGSAASLLVAAGEARRALWLPLRRDGAVIGVVRLTDKLGQDDFDGVDRACAEKFARFAESALSNALRFAELERRSLEDSTTGAYTFEYFQDIVRNEIEKADRFGRSFSLLEFDLGSLESRRRRGGTSDPERRLEAVVERVRPLLRATDLLAARGGRHLYALLPEAGALGAATLKRRTRAALDESSLFRGRHADGPGFHVGVASYPGDGTQLESLLRTLDDRVDEERRSPVWALDLEHRSFAESLQVLLERGHAERPEVADQVTRFVLGEIGRRPRTRGVCLVAPGAALERAVRDGLDSLGGQATATEIVLIADGERHPPFADLAVTRVSPRRTASAEPFLILYGDGPAYAMVRSAKSAGEEVGFFHTDDRSVVEHLAFQLRRELSLQMDGHWEEIP